MSQLDLDLAGVVAPLASPGDRAASVKDAATDLFQAAALPSVKRVHRLPDPLLLVSANSPSERPRANAGQQPSELGTALVRPHPSGPAVHDSADASSHPPAAVPPHTPDLPVANGMQLVFPLR